MTHNEEALRFGVGDVVLVDVSRPATFFAGTAGESWNTMALLLPRQALVSHLGFEPRGGLYRRNETVFGRLLLDLIRNAGKEEVPPRVLNATCGSRSMILSAPFLRRVIRRQRVTRTSCSCASVASSRMASSIHISILPRWRQERGFHCVISRNYLRSAARRAVNSSIHSVWITPHVFYSANPPLAQARRSERLRTHPVFATTAISREGSVSVLVTHRGHTLQANAATARVH